MGVERVERIFVADTDFHRTNREYREYYAILVAELACFPL